MKLELPKAQLQRACGGFLACIDQFQSLVPAKFANHALVEIHKAFLINHCIVFLICALSPLLFITFLYPSQSFQSFPKHPGSPLQILEVRNAAWRCRHLADDGDDGSSGRHHEGCNLCATLGEVQQRGVLGKKNITILTLQ